MTFAEIYFLIRFVFEINKFNFKILLIINSYFSIIQVNSLFKFFFEILKQLTAAPIPYSYCH